MRRLTPYILCGALFLLAPRAYAGNFAPEPLKISAPSQVNIQYGYPLTFPFTLSGGPATVGLAIFTRDRAQSVRDVRNGYLGWHYMNYVDTCMYISPPQPFQPGNNTIVWDGRDERGYHAIIYQHRYYLWAYDTESPPGKATDAFRGYGFGRSALITRDEQGNPLANPVLFSAARPLDPSGETWNTRARWVIGGDPDDSSLLETTRYRSQPDRGRMAVSLRDYRLFFAQTIESGKMAIREWEWIPNGDAVLRPDWGLDGMIYLDSTLSPDSTSYCGPLAVTGDYLLSTTDLAQRDAHSFPALDYFDVNDGSHLKRIDLSPWFGEDTVPTEAAQQYNRLLLSSPGSALFLTVNPYAEEESYFALWANGPGDGFGDTLPAPGAQRGAAMDRNGFVHFADNGSGPSIGLFAPDGAGAGLFPLPGMAGSHMDGMQVIDTGSAFDGIYFGTSDQGGEVRQVRFAMCEGMVTDPAEWFFPHVFIVRPWEGDSLPAGKTFPITWHGVDCGAVRIEFSSDNGASWTTVTGNVTQANFYGDYLWTVPDIRSTTCRLRLTSTVNPLLENTSRTFTITGPSAIANESTPRPFITVSNSPNPFNPSTAIRYDLGQPGRTTLTVYNALGQQVRRADLGARGKGAHEYIFDGAGLTSGVYLYRIATEHASSTGRMLMMK